jgi:hypothetical protein
MTAKKQPAISKRAVRKAAFLVDVISDYLLDFLRFAPGETWGLTVRAFS